MDRVFNPYGKQHIPKSTRLHLTYSCADNTNWLYWTYPTVLQSRQVTGQVSCIWKVFCFLLLAQHFLQVLSSSETAFDTKYIFSVFDEKYSLNYETRYFDKCLQITYLSVDWLVGWGLQSFFS